MIYNDAITNDVTVRINTRATVQVKLYTVYTWRICIWRNGGMVAELDLSSPVGCIHGVNWGDTEALHLSCSIVYENAEPSRMTLTI